MIYTTETVQGDLIDPATGERCIVRIPTWAGADIVRHLADVAAELAALRQQVHALPPAPQPLPLRAQPAIVRVQTTALVTDDAVPVAVGVWTDAGYLPPGSF
jgi:hypothetical protein